MSYKKKPLGLSLVIVESPAKCKKIEGYLGPGYKCIASFGHFRELRSLEDIQFQRQCQITFHIDPKKKSHIELMKREIKAADEIILATDDDREGEAIAWHICSLFGLSLETTKRIVFHEITEKAIQSAIKSPTRIHMPIVHAQQARQVLDLLVGFKLSPLLWSYISKKAEHSLSAGRCQTPALRLIYENSLEITNNPGKQVYNTVGYFTNKRIPFDLKKQFETDSEVSNFLEETVNFDHIFKRGRLSTVEKSAPVPFTTSKIQQAASNELHYSPKETMSLCQTLYEGGYITYMRTDSTQYSSPFVDQVKQYIVETFGSDKYISPRIDDLVQTSGDDDEDVLIINNKDKDNEKEKEKAHEAIRVTDLSVLEVSPDMKPREKRLYTFIWQNTVASCMSDAQYSSLNATITGPLNTLYSTTEELPLFLGWQQVYKKKEKEKEKEEASHYSYLLQLKDGAILPYQKVSSKVSLKDKKQHYTEARLISLLEEKGIGRPSTFASLLDKIIERGYVKKMDIQGQTVACKDFELEDDILNEINTKRDFGNEKGKLCIQPVGILVIEFLLKHFDHLFQYDYTNAMELKLDAIVKGQTVWHEVCNELKTDLDVLCAELKAEEIVKKCEIKIDNEHSYMIGKYGPVIKKGTGKTATFLSIKPDIDLKRLEKGEYTLEELLLQANSSSAIGEYEGSPVYIKKGKYGLYASWNSDKGPISKNLSSLGNRPPENITWLEVLPLLEEERKQLIPTALRTITKDLSIRSGKFGDYLFYKTEKMKKPTFLKLHGFKENHMECHIDALKTWVETTYKINL